MKNFISLADINKKDLRKIIERAKDQKKNDKKANLLILSGAVTVALVVFLLLNL